MNIYADVRAITRETPLHDETEAQSWKRVCDALNIRLCLHEGRRVKEESIGSKTTWSVPRSLPLAKFSQLPHLRECDDGTLTGIRHVSVMIARAAREVTEGGRLGEQLAKELYEFASTFRKKQRVRRSVAQIARRPLGHSDIEDAEYILKDLLEERNEPEKPASTEISPAAKDDCAIAVMVNDVVDPDATIDALMDSLKQSTMHCKPKPAESATEALERNVRGKARYLLGRLSSVEREAASNGELRRWYDHFRATLTRHLSYPKEALMDALFLAQLSSVPYRMRIPARLSSVGGRENLLRLVEQELWKAAREVAVYRLKQCKEFFAPRGRYSIAAKDTDPGSSALASADELTGHIANIDASIEEFGQFRITNIDEWFVNMFRGTVQPRVVDRWADGEDLKEVCPTGLTEALQLNRCREYLSYAHQTCDDRVVGRTELQIAKTLQYVVCQYEYEMRNFGVDDVQGGRMNCVGRTLLGSACLDALEIRHVTVSLRNVPHAIELLVTRDGRLFWLDFGAPGDTEEITDADLEIGTVAQIVDLAECNNGNETVEFAIKPRKKNIHGTKLNERFRGAASRPEVGHRVMMLEWVACECLRDSRFEEALKVSGWCADTCPSDAPYSIVGKALAGLKRFDELRTLAHTALRNAPTDEPQLYELGASLLYTGLFQEAEMIFGHLRSRMPDHRFVSYHHSCCLLALGKYAEALSGFGRTLKMGMRLVDIARNILLCLEKLGHTSAAEAIRIQLSALDEEYETDDIEKDEIWEYFEVWDFGGDATSRPPTFAEGCPPKP